MDLQFESGQGFGEQADPEIDDPLADLVVARTHASVAGQGLVEQEGE